MQNYYQQMPPAGAPPYQGYYPMPPQLTPKQLERRDLRKTANGLGFFVLTYFLVMQVVAIIIAVALRYTGAVTEENQNSISYLLQIVAAVLSSLVAVFFYRIISRRRLSDNLTKSHVPISLLAPFACLGMAASMIANQLAALFDQNISIFDLKNTVDMSFETKTAPEMLLCIVAVSITPALAEELAFRGVFMNILRPWGDAVAIVVSAVMFGAMHGNTTQIIFAFLLGLIFGYVDCKTNSIVPSVVIHFINNFYAVSTDIINQNGIFDSDTVTALNIGMIIMFLILGVLSYVYLAKRDNKVFKVTDKPSGGAKSELTLKEKFVACFTTPGIIVSLSFFIFEMLMNLIPEEALENALMNALG